MNNEKQRIEYLIKVAMNTNNRVDITVCINAMVSSAYRGQIRANELAEIKAEFDVMPSVIYRYLMDAITIAIIRDI